MNEDYTPVESTESPEPAVEQTESKPEPKPGGFALQVDQNTGRRKIVSFADAPEEEPKPQEPQGEPLVKQPIQPQVQPQPPRMLPYSNAGEIVNAIRTNTLDERRIPAEMAFQYAQYLQQNAPQPQENTAQVEQARTEFYTKVESLAKKSALEDLKLTEDDLVAGEYTDDEDLRARYEQYPTALAMHRNNIIQQVQAEQARQNQVAQARQELFSRINNTIQGYQQNEPEWNAINLKMVDYYKDAVQHGEITFDDAIKFQRAVAAYNDGTIDEQSAEDLDRYYQLTRQKVYAEKKNLGTVPKRVPYVEASNNQANAQKMGEGAVTKQQIRNSANNYRVQRQLIEQFFARKGY